MWYPPKKNLRRTVDDSALEKCDDQAKKLFLALKDEMLNDNAYDYYFSGVDTLLLKAESDNVTFYGLKKGKIKERFVVWKR